MLKYMRIPSTAGTRDPERSRFFHNLLAAPVVKVLVTIGYDTPPQNGGNKK